MGVFMLYSEKHRFVYMGVAKTCTTSIERVLEDKFDASLWDWEGIVPTRENHHQNQKLEWSKHITHLPEELSEYMVFASIRNPYRHERSRYYNQCVVEEKKPSIEGFRKYLNELTPRWSFYIKLNRHPEYIPPPGS